MADTKNVTLRLSTKDIEVLAQYGSSVNQSVKNIAQKLETIRKLSYIEVKKLLSAEDFKYFSENLPKIEMPEGLRYNADALCDELRAIAPNEELFQKLRTLTAAQLDALLAQK